MARECDIWRPLSPSPRADSLPAAIEPTPIGSGRRPEASGVQRASAAVSASVIDASRRSPSSADARAGSPRTPFGLTAATPPRAHRGQQFPRAGPGCPPRPRRRGRARGAGRASSTSRCGPRGRRRPGRRRTRRRRGPRTRSRRTASTSVGDVAAVAVDEHQPPRPAGRRPPQLDEQQPQRLVPDRHASRGSPRARPTRRRPRAGRRAGRRCRPRGRRRRRPPGRRCRAAGAGRAARWTRRARAASAGRRSPARPARRGPP